MLATFGSSRVALEAAVRRRTARAARFTSKDRAATSRNRPIRRFRQYLLRMRCDECRRRIGYICRLK
ncbi:Hypothetical protein BN69_1799 [Methylocystis sp. SC2]|nr:Hypothetical protein BN69_1799 [Methylocystis sp. SC2]